MIKTVSKTKKKKVKLHGQARGIHAFTVKPEGLPVERNPAPRIANHPLANPRSSGARIEPKVVNPRTRKNVAVKQTKKPAAPEPVNPVRTGASGPAVGSITLPSAISAVSADRSPQ